MDTVTSNNNQSIHVYLRVSTKDQEFDSQIESIHKVIPNLELKQRLDNQLDIQQDNKVNVYQEKASGAKKYNRLELTRLLSNLKAGDIVIVNDISRLSRSTIDLLTVVEEIRSKGAILRSVQDAWLNSQDMYSDTFLGIFASFAQLERKLISRRTKEGLEAAKQQGRFGGRPNKTTDKEDFVLHAYKSNKTISEIVRQTGLSRTSVYNILNRNNAIQQRE